MRLQRVFQVLFFSATLPACSTAIHSTHITSAETKVPSGILYYLPATAISASMSFIPTACKINQGGEVEFAYDIADAVVKHSYVQDANHQYVFNYSELNSKLKITTANVELYGIGTFKSINTTVDDRTAEVIGAVGSTALNLVKAAAFVPAVAVSVGVKSTNPCPAVIVRHLEELDGLSETLAQAKVADADLQGKLNELEEARTALASAKAKAAATPNDAALKVDAEQKAAQVTKLEALVKGGKLTVPGVQKRIAAVSNVVSGSARVLFVPTVNKQCAEATMSGAAYLRQFLKVVKPGEHEPLQAQIDLIDDDVVFKASICVKTANGTMRTTEQTLITKASSDEAAPPGGIVYRQPIMAQVTVSQTENDIADFSGERWISIPQYGTMASLDLVNGPFDKNTLKLGFAEDGALATLDFTAQSSSERGALAAQSLSKAYLDIVTARENAKLARESAVDAKEKKVLSDEIAKYENELRLLNAKGAVTTKVLGKDPVQAEIEATELETNLLKKQIERETARQNLAKLKGTVP